MTAITEDMITRALDTIMTAPGLSYFNTVEAVTHNREVVRRALAAALRVDADGAVSDEDRIREAMTEAMEHPGREVMR